MIRHMCRDYNTTYPEFTPRLQGYTPILQGYTSRLQSYTPRLQGYTPILQGYILQDYRVILQDYRVILQVYSAIFQLPRSQGYTSRLQESYKKTHPMSARNSSSFFCPFIDHTLNLVEH